MERVSIISIILSIFTFCFTIIQTKNQHKELATEIHRQFSEMWFEMDGIFIKHPEQHKYFYPSVEGQPCKEIPLRETEEWDEAICIAEKFRDIFQYSEPLAIELVKIGKREEALSYYFYLCRIINCPIYKEMDKLNPIDINNDRRNAIGERLKVELKLL